MGETYDASGVDIAAGEEAVERIRSLVESTARPEVLGGIGGFGGLFDISRHGLDHPVLVSATDGVGTKAQVATLAGRYDTIGIDLVAMCVDDLVCAGAEPLFFLDYISVGNLEPDMAEALVAGVAEGCRQAGCALVGGEMAEHPGAMEPGEFDLVGFAVGSVDRDAIVDGSRAQAGDLVVGLASPGLRSNGYSLARRLLFELAGRSLDEPAFGGGPSVGEELLRPSVIYAPAVLELMRRFDVRSIADITGGGLPGNIGRSLPGDVDVVVDRSAWEVPPIFAELQRIGEVAADEMDRVFNLGIGMTLVVPADGADQVCAAAAELGRPAAVIGELAAGEGAVRYV